MPPLCLSTFGPAQHTSLRPVLDRQTEYSTPVRSLVPPERDSAEAALGGNSPLSSDYSLNFHLLRFHRGQS